MKTILLIEDNPYDARLIAQALKGQEYLLHHAADAASGLEMAVECNPDLILLDLGLPDLDGQTVAALIKNEPDLEDVPLVAVTAWPPATARDMAQAYGCMDYISKPIEVRKLVGKIEGFLKT
jgi:two-component system cell cycle response regulator DivK